MSHVDDGKLNALLDGELPPAEASAVQAHIGACAECAKRLEDAKRFLADAADLLGALDPPKPVEVPVRRVSRTAKEVALDLDGATHKSPAVPPIFARHLPPPAPQPTGVPRRLDFTTLAWAATLVLALGVGYLANEVKHSRDGIALGEERATGQPAPASQAAPTTAPASSPAASAGAARGRPSANAPAQGAAPARGAGVRPSAGTATSALANAATARKSAPTRSEKQLAAGGAVTGVAAEGARALRAVGREPAPPAGAGAGPAPATQQLRAAPAADRVAQPPARAVAPQPKRTAATRAAEPLTTFRRATLEEAVARLRGAIRLIDGMRVERVEVGPGSHVPGANRTRDVVRVLYRDANGRPLELEQQRIGAPSGNPPGAHDATAAANIGMGFGDTLLTMEPSRKARIRWTDRGDFWLSLTGSLPPDSLRRLVVRVR